MRAMILAAGRGQRMGALTENCPKPLLEVAGKPLIVHHIERLKAAGISDIVINTAYLSEQITTALGDGSAWGVHITYSHETGAGLEVAGGIINALPLLGDEPFVTVNADIYTDFDFKTLQLPENCLAHCVLVANPEHNATGDFGIGDGLLRIDGQPRYTFSGIGCYAPGFFATQAPGRAPLKPLLIDAAKRAVVSAEVYPGQWFDVGTPERLTQIQSLATKKSR